MSIQDIFGLVAEEDRQDDQESRSRSQVTADLLMEARGADAATIQQITSRVVMIHLDVAESVAFRYRRRGQDHQDLVQVARLGLIEAVERFDPDRGPFLAYAIPTMTGHVKRYFRDHGWMVRPPRHIQEKQAKIARARDELTQALQRRPTASDVGAHLSFSDHEVREALDIQGCFHPASLDAALALSSHGLNALLAVREPELDSIDARATIGPACRLLPARERRLVYLRYVEMCTQEEIAAEFGISQMQVSRWLVKTLARLRQTIGETDPGSDIEPTLTPVRARLVRRPIPSL